MTKKQGKRVLTKMYIDNPASGDRALGQKYITALGLA